MTTLARAAFWMFAAVVATFAIATGIAGILFLHSAADLVMAFYVAVAAVVLGAYAIDALSGLAPDLGVDVMTDLYRVRNRWWRRHQLGVLAGGSTALSYQRASAYR